MNYNMHISSFYFKHHISRRFIHARAEKTQFHIRNINVDKSISYSNQKSNYSLAVGSKISVHITIYISCKQGRITKKNYLLILR
jgi:hypothetical protein